MFIRDDTDEIFTKISHHHFMKLHNDILYKGKTGSSIYAMCGRVSGGKDKEFKMFWVDSLYYIGELKGSNRKMAPTMKQEPFPSLGDA
jgi:hypothetical protein